MALRWKTFSGRQYLSSWVREREREKDQDNLIKISKKMKEKIAKKYVI